MTYNDRIKRSPIPNKTIWDTVKTETGRTTNNMTDKNCKLRNGENMVHDYAKIVETFNQHFLTITKTNSINNIHNTSSVKNNYKISPMHYLYQSFNCIFPSFKLTPLSTKDIGKIIKSLNTKTLTAMTKYQLNC